MKDKICAFNFVFKTTSFQIFHLKILYFDQNLKDKKYVQEPNIVNFLKRFFPRFLVGIYFVFFAKILKLKKIKILSFSLLHKIKFLYFKSDQM